MCSPAPLAGSTTTRSTASTHREEMEDEEEEEEEFFMKELQVCQLNDVSSNSSRSNTQPGKVSGDHI